MKFRFGFPSAEESRMFLGRMELLAGGDPEPDPPGGGDSVPPVDPPADPSPVDPPSDPEPPQDPPVEPSKDAAPPTPPKPDWREKQLAKARNSNKEKDAEIARLRAQLEPFVQNQQPKDPTPSQADIDRLVNERAAELAANNQFTKDVQALAEAGKTAYQDWDSQMIQLGGLVDTSDQSAVAAYSTLVGAAIRTGQGAQVLYALSRDPNEAERVMNLSPVDMGIELAKLAYKPDTPPSNAPRPIRPVQGANAARSEIRPDDPDRADTLAIDEWMARRNATAWDRPQQGRRAG